MRRTILAAAIAAAAIATTGCSSSEPADDAKPKPTTVVTESPTYDSYDCRALLERNYDDDNAHDASDEPQCAALTKKQYQDVVADVLTGRKDEIVDNAVNETAWDEAWKQTDPEQRDTVCERLRVDGPEIVGAEMADSTGDDENDQIAMSRYLLKEKC